MVPFQNANHSVRVTDEFMRAVVGNDEWDLLARDGTRIETLQARDIWDAICTAAWECGDPGLQFDTTINRWHTSPAHGRINGSNPCQPATATVLTPDGIRTFADIDVGSIIWSGERWTRVTHKIPTGKKPVYRFITRAGVFVGTEDHRVVEENTKIAIKDATTVRTSQGACPEPCVFDPQAVIDGMVLGDGSMIHANGGANQYPVLYIGDGDQCYFEASHGVAEFINSEPYEVKCHRVNTTLTAEDLPKTYERRVPKSYLEGDSRVTRSFLRGLYTANGSICGNRVTLKASSLAVTEGVQQMLSSIGIRSYYTINKAHEVEFENGTYLCRESYNLNISTDRGLFRALIGFIHPHKGERLDNICEVRSVSSRGPKLSYEIVDREFLGCVPVYDITVEAEEHTYWTGGLLVSNCSEYMFLDDTACNLASINLLKFLDDDFLIGDFRHTVDVLITAMDIIVGAAGYPTPKITENSHKFRTLGLGYSNLGAYLQAQGVAYDSEEGRMQAASITAILSGRGYACSSHLAARLGAFAGFEVNRGKMLSIMRQHRDAAVEIEDQQSVLGSILKMHAEADWTRCITLGEQHAYRNAQISVIAPAGTISFMMDCDTTGIEPELSLRKTKKLVGGGTLQIVNQQVARALDKLGYDINQIEAIEKYIEEHNSVVGAPGIQDQHLGVFDTSFPEGVNGRHISPRAHVRMMGAVQPFVSGAISKTVNLPANTTVEEISEIYMFAWERGLKSVALYRDGCKRTQPLTADGAEAVESATAPAPLQLRRKLPNDCLAHRHHFEIGNQSGYLHVGLYPDGKPGELFVTMAKEGSTVSGLMDAIGVLTSIALQYGVPLGVLVDKFSYTNFEPAGITNNSEIRFAQSPLDYIFRFMGLQFLQDGAPEAPGEPAPIKEISSGGQTCTRCGNGLQRAGSCLTCSTCGWSEGCG
jgi:ribonucleoside-diphosphate reductase alpha chain